MNRRYLLLYVLFSLCTHLAWAQPFADEIAAFKKQDSVQAPPKHAILFVGSSSFRMWTNLQQSFPKHTVINRGFGGSCLPDVIRYANDIILPYQPRQIVIYCGENDLASSDTVTAKMVYSRFVQLYKIIRRKMPVVPIVYVSIKPSPSRAKLMPAMKESNRLISSFLRTQKHTVFVDVFSAMLKADGTSDTSLFIEDNLHMNAAGYAIWQKMIEPYLLKEIKTNR